MLLAGVIPSRVRDSIICTGQFSFSIIYTKYQCFDGLQTLFLRWLTGFSISEDERLAPQEPALFVGMDYRMYAGLAQHVSFNVFAFFCHFFLNVSAVQFLMWTGHGWNNYPTPEFFGIYYCANCSFCSQYFCFLQQSKIPALTIPSSSRFYISFFTEMQSNFIYEVSRR